VWIQALETEAACTLFRASSATGFGFDVDMLALAAMAGYHITEIPALWEHREGSKLKVSRNAIKCVVSCSQFVAICTCGRGLDCNLAQSTSENWRPRLPH
jgi:hypothetical protein